MTITHVARLHDTIVTGGVAIEGVDAEGKVTPANLQGTAQPIIDGFDDSDAAQATWQAQQEKAEATKGVDDALTTTGGRVERAVMSVAYSISKAENNTRLALFQVGNAIRDATTLADLKVRIAAISFPQEVTPAQVSAAVKAAIAETPE